MKKLLLILLAIALLYMPSSAGNGTGLYTTKQLDIHITGSGDNTVIPAQGAGQRIIVWKMWLVDVGGATNLTFKDGSTTLNAGVLPLTAAGSSITFQYDGEPYWSGSANQNFIINNSAANEINGRIYFTVVGP